MPTPEEYLRQVQEQRNKLNEYSQQALRQRQELDQYSQQALRQQELLRQREAALPKSYSQKELRQTQAGIQGFQYRQKVVQTRTDLNKAVVDIDKVLSEVEQGKKDIDVYLAKVKTANEELDKAEKEVNDYISSLEKYKLSQQSGGTQTGKDYEAIFKKYRTSDAGGFRVDYTFWRGRHRNERGKLVGGEVQAGIARSPEELKKAMESENFAGTIGMAVYHGGRMKRDFSDAEKEMQMEMGNIRARAEMQKASKFKEIEVNPEVRQAFEAKYGVGATFGNLQTGASNALGVGQRFESITKNGQLSGYTDTRTGKQIDVGKFAQYLVNQGFIPSASAKDINKQFNEYNKELQNYNVKLSQCCDENGNVLPGKEYMIPELQRDQQRLEVLKQGCDASVANATYFPSPFTKEGIQHYAENKEKILQAPSYAVGKYLGELTKHKYAGAAFVGGFTPIGMVGTQAINLIKTGKFLKPEDKVIFPSISLNPNWQAKLSTKEALMGPIGFYKNISNMFTVNWKKEMTAGEMGASIGISQLYLVPGVGTALMVSDVLGTTGRVIKGGTEYIKSNQAEAVMAGGMILGGVLHAGSKFKVNEVKIPVEGGVNRTVWKGITYKDFPVIGKAGERITLFIPSTNKINIKGINLGNRGWLPETKLESKILARKGVFENIGVSSEAAKVYEMRGKLAQKIAKYGTENSEFVAKQFERKIGSLSPAQVEAGLKASTPFVKEITFKGSFSSEPQLKSEVRYRSIHDIDQQFIGSQERLMQYRDVLFKALKETPGKEVRISPSKSTLIESWQFIPDKKNPKTGKMGWEHAWDIHPESKPSLTYNLKNKGAYGFTFEGKPVEIEGLKAQGLGEQLKRKLAGSVLWQKGGQTIEIKGIKNLGIKEKLPKIEIKSLKEIKESTGGGKAFFSPGENKIVLPKERIKEFGEYTKQELFKHEFGHFLTKFERELKKSPESYKIGSTTYLQSLYKKYPERASSLERLKQYPIEERGAEIKAETLRLTKLKDIYLNIKGEPIKVSALPWRMKDISDVPPALFTLSESMKKNVFNRVFKFNKIVEAPRLIKEWRKAYPEIDWAKVSTKEYKPELFLSGEQLSKLYGKKEVPYVSYNIYSLSSTKPYGGYRLYSLPSTERKNYFIGGNYNLQKNNEGKYSLPITYNLSKKYSFEKYNIQPNYGHPTIKINEYKIPKGYNPPTYNPRGYNIPEGKRINIPKLNVVTTGRTGELEHGRKYTFKTGIRDYEQNKKQFDEGKKKKKRMALAWKILVKRRGAWNYLTGEYTRGEAMRVGAEKTMTTLGRTFKIVPYRYRLYEGDEPNYIPSEAVFRRYKVIRGVKYPLQDIWIQKAHKSLMTRSEVREIQAERRRAAENANMFNFKSRRSKSKWF